MPADALELQEALDEGVHAKWLRTITQVDEGTMRLEEMQLDENGTAAIVGVRH